MPRKKRLSATEFLASLAREIRTTKDEVEAHEQQATAFLRRAIYYAHDTGALLIRAKGYLKWMRKKGRTVPGFMDWVAAETGLSQGTANNYMRIHRNWDELLPLVQRQNGLSIDEALQILRNGRLDDKSEMERGRKPDKKKDGCPDEFGDDGDEEMREYRKFARAELRRVFTGWLLRLGPEALKALAYDPTYRFYNVLHELSHPYHIRNTIAAAMNDPRKVRREVAATLNRLEAQREATEEDNVPHRFPDS